MPSVLISGASRGLGLEFARQYAAAGWQVHATIRDPVRGTQLETVAGDVIIHRLDVTDKASLDTLAATLKSVPIDLLIANAGVTGPRGMSAELVDRESWVETFEIDAIAPIALAGTFKPNLIKGTLKKAVAVSSRLGSIAENVDGGLYVYRSSKAAMNAAWRSLAIDWQGDGICCALLSPGWVRTDMGGPNAELDPPESIAGMIAVIDRLTLADTGRFLSYTGEEIPW